VEASAVRSAETVETWPALPLEEWEDTRATLHMWTQIVGKVRLARAPMINHWWQVPLYVTPRGLTTSAIPDGSGAFSIDFDFIDHRLLLKTNAGEQREVALYSRSVADFYGEVMAQLRSLGSDVKIWTHPVEIEDAIPFEHDEQHATYDPAQANRFWAALVQSERVLTRFRSGFTGKCSPVHFFWGSFDMAVTRFSGRGAPPHPGGIPNVADWVTRESYNRECSSCGFWPGTAAAGEAIFYAYAYPEPPGFGAWPLRPDAATYNGTLREFVLPYQAVRTAPDPDAMLLEFCQSSYDAAADLGGWNRAELERHRPPGP
jgi:hypothetical protein